MNAACVGICLTLFAGGAMAITAAARADAVKATFITGTWALKDGCEKQKLIDAGGNKNVGTVPELLSDQGFDSWEGGCAFVSIAEKMPGKLYVAKMACSDSAEEWDELDTFEIDGATIKVSVEGKTTEFVRCETNVKENR